MPQLDTLSYFNQFTWLVIIISVLYVIVISQISDVFTKVKYRNWMKETKSEGLKFESPKLVLPTIEVPSISSKANFKALNSTHLNSMAPLILKMKKMNA